MIYEATSFECSRIAQDLQIRKLQVEALVQLLNEGNTVPFIARYRKEKTGGLDEEVLRQVQSRLNFLKQLNERKQTILKSIENQGKLTGELRVEILHAPTVRRLEDLYLPFKPKKKSLAEPARKKGLEPLAMAIWHSDPAVADLAGLLPSLVNPENQLNTIEEVQTGVQHILAEMINEIPELRGQLRRLLWKSGTLTSTRNEKVPEGQGNEFKPFFQFKESTQDIRPHRILALNRGEKEGVLTLKLEWPMDVVQKTALTALGEHLLAIAGKPPEPSAPPKPAEPPAPTPAPAPEAPPSEIPPVEAPPIETPPVESPPVENPPPIEAPPAEMPPTAPPASPTVPPHAAPLVESLSTEAKPALTGDLLVEGVEFRSPHAAFLKYCLDDALQRLTLPSLERDIRSELTDEAELHAVKVFAHNIRSLLMQPTLVGKRVLAIDPAYRTGCKVTAIDEAGNLLGHLVIYPFGGPWEKKKGKDKKAQEKAPAPPTVPEPTAPSPTVAPPGLPTEIPIVAPGMDIPAPPALAEVPSANASSGPESSATPETPVDKVAEAKAKLVEFANKHNVNAAAIGGGPACREFEALLADVIAHSLTGLTYAVVSEAGISAYVVSPLAKEELPNIDAGIRASVSVGRRLQDALSELAKVEPQGLALGLYHHDMGRKELKETLEGVVESCVNHIGVDVNSASVSLLRHVSGLNQMVAREIVEHRKANGPFTSREQLLTLPSMTPARYAQAAGFLKVPGSTNPLDHTWIHPESYGLAERVVAELGYSPSVIDDKAGHIEFRKKLNEVDLKQLSAKLEVSETILDDLFFALARPGRDPRNDMPLPIFKKGILKLEDLQPGMELKGTVLNVVDFGAFVDVGLKDSGLVHISQIANKYIKSPYDVVSVNDVVTVWVLKIDKDSNHVSLTMIRPGSDRGVRDEGRGARGEGREPRGEGREPSRPPAARGDRGEGRPPRDGGRPQRDRRGPPRHGQPRPQREAAPPPPSLPLPPRKPKREVPMPKLTQEAMSGKAPLRTLSELAAFFKAKEEKEKPPPAPPESPSPSEASPTAQAEATPVPAESLPESKPAEGEAPPSGA